MLQTRTEFGFIFTTCLHKQVKQSPFLLPDTLTNHFMLPWENSNKTVTLFCIGAALFDSSQTGQSPGLMLLFRKLWPPSPTHRTCWGSLASQCLQELGSSQFLLPPPELGVNGLPAWHGHLFELRPHSLHLMSKLMQVGSQCSLLLHKWCLAAFWLGLSSTFLNNFQAEQHRPWTIPHEQFACSHPAGD